MPKFIIKILDTAEDNLIKNDDIDCFLLSSNLAKEDVFLLVEAIRAEDKLVLIEGANAIELCQEAKADGIVADLSDAKQIKKEINAIKSKLGDLILGVVCRPRRHEAMVVSENEPDFIVFRTWEQGQANILALTKWYSELFFMQQALMIEEDGVDYRDYASDMVIVSPQQYKILVA